MKMRFDKERGKTPWENMEGENSTFIKNLNKSKRRLEREKRVESLMSQQPTDPKLLHRPLNGLWAKIYWWALRIGLGINVGLLAMVLYSKYLS